MKNILLIGLGRFGKHVALQMNQLGHEVMAVDVNEERVNKVLPFVTNAQIGDSTDAEFLKSLGIGNYDICSYITRYWRWRFVTDFSGDIVGKF